jgi:DNA gyrase/topoisomerase IV subunit A
MTAVGPRGLWSLFQTEHGCGERLEGKVIGIPTTQVRSSGRATKGVRLIKLEDKDRVCSIAKVRES